MPVVLLVRHGQASFGAQDYDRLSDLGATQARALGDEVRRRQLRDPWVVTGTLRRQLDTALHAGLEASVVDGRWDEYDHLELVRRHAGPTVDGLDSPGFQKVLDDALLAWIAAPDDAGWPAFGAAAAAALAAVVALRRDAIVITSGGVITALCASLLGLPPEGVVALNRVLANAAITKVVVGRAGTSLVAVNDHAHFEGAARHLLTYR